MGLNIVKFHATVHPMEDILMHGVPLEFDTVANESHHKMSKVAAKLTQRNESTFNFQVALGMWEFCILDLAIHELRTGRRNSDCFDPFSDQSASEMSTDGSDSDQQDEENEQSVEVSTGDAQISVFWDEEADQVGFELKSRSKFNDQTACWSFSTTYRSCLVSICPVMVWASSQTPEREHNISWTSQFLWLGTMERLGFGRLGWIWTASMSHILFRGG